MLDQISGLEDRFLDRYGCGDEFYLDSRLKRAQFLRELGGSELVALAIDEGDLDEAAMH